MNAADIKILVAADFGISVRKLDGVSRSQPIVRARWAAMWLLREARGLSTTQIGAQLGGKDHTTVVYGLKMIEELRGCNLALAARLDGLLRAATRDAAILPADLAGEAANRLIVVMIEAFRDRLRRLSHRDPQAFVARAMAMLAEGDAPCAP